MTKRIAFVGAAGCGKTTMTLELCSHLKRKGVNVDSITEYVRDYINTYGPPKTIFEQYHIFNNQTMKEDAIAKQSDLVVCDTIRGLGYFYTSMYSSKSDIRERIVLQDMYKFFLNDLYERRYDHIFFLPCIHTYAANPNILNDGTRFQTMDEINTLENYMMLFFGNLHKMDNVHILDCPLSERLTKVLEITGL